MLGKMLHSHVVPSVRSCFHSIGQNKRIDCWSFGSVVRPSDSTDGRNNGRSITAIVLVNDNTKTNLETSSMISCLMILRSLQKLIDTFIAHLIPSIVVPSVRARRAPPRNIRMFYYGRFPEGKQTGRL